MKNLQAKRPSKSVKPGDIFVLGDHILGCGDAADSAFVKKLIGKEKIQLCLTDPPYGVAYVESKQNFKQGIKHKVILNDHLQSEKEYSAFTQKWLEAMKPHLASKNSCYIFNSDRMLFALRDGMQNAGFKFSQLLIWVKTQAVIGRLDYLPMHELIAYGWFGRHHFRKSKDKSVLVYPKPSKSEFHATQKPVGLLRRLILNSSEIGDIVYDPFLGSGSTLLAAEQTKRKCIGIEIDPEYCQVVISRWESLTKLKAQKL
ncbi:MAG: site-specific DNA-methyltransferase [Patescibacteria group bacterium]|jgi:DNA modification methylase